MQAEAATSMLIKVPLTCLALLTVCLALLNLVGIIKVEMDQPSSRLILLVAFYLTLICGVIVMRLKSIRQIKTNLNSTTRLPTD